MNFQNLLTEIRDGILLLTISRPEKLNALNQQTIQELSECVTWIQQEPSIKAVLLTGQGEKAFVAGADITEFLDMTDQEKGAKLAKKGQDVFFQIENSSKPFLAAVNGYALGGGCELALACHIRVASENAQFAQPEITLGIIPGYGGTQRLTQLVGKGKALELMLTADKVDAANALRLGLVNHVTTLAELLPFSIALLNRIINKPPVAIAMTISAANQSGQSSGYQTEHENFGKCVATNDFKEGVTAFLEKRKASFKGN